jgi:chemosensory pili system protein ChpA (sensor histidine kinase/response regulator)
MQQAAREISVALADARTALETHVEQPANSALLERCSFELHQVQGALRVLEIYGAALLAEEMEQVARYLISTRSESKNQSESLDALMRAMVQLPGYLERVLAGGRDLALVLLPLLNDLRAVRGSALLSEGTLLLLNLKSDRQAQPTAPAPGEAPLSPAQWARRLRSRFQSGLVGWIRGERLEQNLEILATVATRLEQVATQQCVFQLWWVVGALLEALREHGVESSVTIKRLLGLADREIKRLHEIGEARYAQAPPIELLNNLLYYVARSTTAGPRVAAVRASFRLNELLPVDEGIEQERENLSAPSVKLMHTVAAAIREDLTRVKDVLDIFVRRGGGQVEELSPQIEMLRKIGDTLGVLGLGELRARVQEANAQLEAVVAGRENPDEATLVKVAATLITVEDHLDSELVGLILPKAPRADARAAGEASGADAGDGTDQDFEQVQGAVLRECVVNLARVKESIAQNVSGTLDAAGFDSWLELMRGIKAGLLMLGKGRAVDVIDAITSQLKRIMQPGGRALSGAYLDRLADAIVSLEYYIETLQAGRSDPWYMLDNAQACLEVLGREPEQVVPTVAPVSAANYARTMRIPPPQAETLPGAAHDPDSTARVRTPPVLAAAAPAVDHAPPADPEMLSLFAEEAHEELEKIREQYPVWDQNPLESSALTTVCRSFHTLKGSGRMVGARELSEFAWAMENLINRVMDGTQARSAEILGTLRAAVELLPRLVDEIGKPPSNPAASAQLVARAHALAAGRDATTPPAAAAPPDGAATRDAVAESAAEAAFNAAFTAAIPPATSEPTPSTLASRSEDVTLAWAATERLTPGEAAAIIAASVPASAAPTAVEPVVQQAAAGAGPEHASVGVAADAATEAAAATAAAREAAAAAEGDAALREIYARETAAHVATVRNWLTREEPHPAPHVLTEEVYRACHTLSGSSKMAEARHGIRLSEPLNHWLRKSFDSGIGLDASDLLLLSDCMAAMATVAAHLDESTSYFVVHDTLRARISRAEHDLDRRIAEASEHSSRTGVHALPMMHALQQAALVPPPPAPSARAPALDFDPDVAAIFCEEASELLESAQTALQAWRASPASVDHLASLKRSLHTFKGGARMAGIGAMGDLSHELESLVVQIGNGAAAGDERARAVAQEAIDELARMREQVAAGRAAPPAQALIANIQAIARGAAPAGEGAPASPAAAATPPSPPRAPIVLPPPTPPSAPLTLEELTPPAAAAPAPPLELPEVALADADDALPDAQPSTAPESQEPAAAAPVSAPLLAAQATAVPPGREPVAGAERGEMARVSAELLDLLLNNAGEVNISRARLEQQLGSVEFNLAELSRTVTRLKEQLRKLEIETEAQVLHRHEQEPGHRQEFDPLELDRYSSIQQYSRALAESANDVASLQQLIESQVGEAQNQLQQQSRTVTELQNGLMRTRMVSFQRHVQRLARIVRQAAADSGKQAEFVVEGATGELDRQVLERMLPPFEHLLRNAVVHGIESPAQRAAAGKDATGRIHLKLQREGAEVIVDVRDDGAGMDLAAIRNKGLALGLINADQVLSDDDVMQLVLEPGFSTAGTVTQQAGRGVGMDVVATEIKKLGGALHMESKAGTGTRFTIRLPLTLAVSHALVVRTGDEYYALPLPTIEGVVRLPREEVAAHLRSESATFTYGDHKYRLQPLALYVGMEAAPLPETDGAIPVVLVRAGEHSTGLVADELIGSREIVVKPLGPQIASIRGISGATILSDGRVVVILDIAALVRAEWRVRAAPTPLKERGDRRTFALVVDDSITVRRVTQRLLERNGMRVMTARDGADAVALLADNVPDIILLDIEMPRMDGYEVAAQVRADPRLAGVPIIMITSRVGDKHRARAIELGVDDYLGKPYQESQLIDAIAPLVARRRAGQVAGAAR